MKTIVNFLKENGYTNDKIYEVGDVSFTIHGNTVVVSYNGDVWGIPASRTDINIKVQDLLYDCYDVEMRYCDECGKPYDAGFMGGDGEWYCCEDCFEPMMDRDFGKGKWRPTEKEGMYGGYYEYLTDSGKWRDTGAFYTEWN
jgi:hypothetical protein